MNEEKQINQKNNSEVKSADEVVAKVPKEAFKAMFYMFTGKPDSQLKVFDNPVIITPNDLIELNTDICDKLTNHHVTATITHR